MLYSTEGTMSFLSRGLFVVTGIIVGTTAINYFIAGNSADYHLPNSRIGAWREAQVRPACYVALERPENDIHRPKLPAAPHRIAMTDYRRMVEMTAALKCYVVTQNNAVCEPNNRAYIVDYIGKYFAKMDDMLETAKRYGADEVGNVRQLWNSDNNQAITAALEDHVRSGHLNRSDFGIWPPAALKLTLEEYAGAADTCPNERS